MANKDSSLRVREVAFQEVLLEEEEDSPEAEEVVLLEAEEADLE